MRKRSTFAGAALAAFLISAPTLAQVRELRLEQVQDPELRRLLTEMKADVDARERAWLAARAAQASALDTISTIETGIARDRALSRRLGVSEESELRTLENAALAAEQARLPALAQNEIATRRRYEAARQRLQAHAAAALGAGAAPPVEVATVTRPDENRCSIDTPLERMQLVPNCVIELLDSSVSLGTELSQTRVTIADRVLDRRGVTTQISVGNNTSSASLRIADSFNYRVVPVGQAPFRQRAANWGYSLGIQSQLDSDRRARIGGIAERDANRRLGNLDRLDAGLSVSGGLSRNFFRSEGEESFQVRATRMAIEARRACLADQAGRPPAAPSTCEGEQLIAWIFARKADGTYANQGHVTAFNEVYWGAHQRVARFGVGITAEVARPSFSFYPFRTVAIADPFSPGDTINVIDRSFIPPEFLAETPLNERHWAYTVGMYSYYHFPFYPADRRNSHFGLTLVPSLTYKVSYRSPTEYEVCLPRAADQVTTNELCRTIRIADGAVQRSWVPGLELRALFPGGRIFFGRALIPEFAIAPRYTFDSRTNRNAVDIPVWFAFDATGQLNGGLRFAWESGGRDADGERRPAATGLYIHFGTTFNIAGN